ncbi:unnamed protein product [Rotaria sordida]|uniref:Exocyst complex component Sec8 n=1 Tax=Rotaria sordida TaxID=392033 RepID=A0A814BRP5_9BILA|nr:unnamed protein product [Rotaria sordida]
MWSFFISIIWLIVNYERFIVASSMIKEFSIDSMINYEKALVSRNTGEYKVDNGHLIDEWQDWILANIISVNYLNSLMVLASRQDFNFSIPTGYSVKYVQNIGSFRQTTAQLATDMRSSLSSAREDLNRVHTGMERVPDHLKNMVLLIKHAPFDLLLMLFPDSFNNIEKLVNDSLIVLRKPEKNFEKVLNLLTEIDYLLNNTSNDIMIYLQVFDVKTQWTHLTELVTELAKQAERTRESFLLQFNWILREFIRPDLTFAETHRDFIILLLLPKIVEIDQTSDILGIITKTYTDISFQFTDEQIGGYTHLLLLSKEEDRQRYLKQFQYDLVPQVVQSARLALNRHNEFLQRDRNRREIYEKFLTETSYNDLISLIG